MDKVPAEHRRGDPVRCTSSKLAPALDFTVGISLAVTAGALLARLDQDEDDLAIGLVLFMYGPPALTYLLASGQGMGHAIRCSNAKRASGR